MVNFVWPFIISSVNDWWSFAALTMLVIGFCVNAYLTRR